MRRILLLRPVKRTYEDYGSDVWRAWTTRGLCALRASRVLPPYYDFWFMLNRMYGIDPQDMHALKISFWRVSEAGGFDAPRIYRCFLRGGREHVLLQWVRGRSVQEWADTTENERRRFAHALARQHMRTYPCFGTAADARMPAEQYHPKMAEVLSEALRRFEHLRTLYAHPAERMLPRIASLSPPRAFALSMPDNDVSQYIFPAKGKPVLVDAETIVLAPPEMDIAALRMQLTDAEFDRFCTYYEEECVLPAWNEVYDEYRFFLTVIGAMGTEPYE